MRGLQMRFQLTAVGLACVTLLSACGGSSDKNKAIAQSITFPFLGGSTVAPPTAPKVVLLMDARASSGLAVSYVSNTPTVCSVDGRALTLLGAGECSVTAVQAGGSGYAPADQRQLFVIPKNAQNVVFFNPGRQEVGASVDLTPAKTDALGPADLYPITYATSTPAVCSLSGLTLTSLAEGKCVVTATQAGTAYFAPISKDINIAVGNFELPPLTLASGYKPKGTSRTLEDGAVETYNEHPSTLDVAADGSTFTFTMTKQANGPGFGGYYGYRVFAPGVLSMVQGANTTKGVQIEGQSTIKFSLSMNPEMIDAGKTKLRVWLILGHYHKWVPSWDPTSKPQDCNVTLEKFFTPTFTTPGVMQEQSLDLRSFTISNSCDAGNLDLWNELQSYPIGKIEINVPDINNQVPNAGTDIYTTSVTMGSVNFK